MATKKVIRFEFAPADTIALSRKGEFPCRICHHDFVVPEVDITILGFTICPTCILSGPAEVAKDADSNAVFKDVLEMWSEDPIDQKGIKKLYFRLAKALRRLDSFEDLPGGAVAVAIARVKPEDLRRGSRRKAA
ncbi:MAG: hypothetical protein ACYC37_01890 [Desulfobacteria bacterium]